MTTKQWLYRAWNIQAEIEQLKREKNEALTDSPVTSNPDNVTVSGTKDPHKPMDSVLMLTEQLDKFIDRKNRILIEIQDAIESLYDYRGRTMLRLRYIERKPWKKIYEEMNYSIPQCKRIEKLAMHEISNYIWKRNYTTDSKR